MFVKLGQACHFYGFSNTRRLDDAVYSTECNTTSTSTVKNEHFLVNLHAHLDQWSYHGGHIQNNKMYTNKIIFPKTELTLVVISWEGSEEMVKKKCISG